MDQSEGDITVSEEKKKPLSQGKGSADTRTPDRKRREKNYEHIKWNSKKGGEQ